ncbi:MAG: inositol-3-phosphate synthase [Candidatus Bathyarchaeia archaeon]
MPDIRLAVIGVGNCCSALVQGIQYYGDEKPSLGLIHPRLGGYCISDIRFVAAFDVDDRKVGQDLSQAIFSKPNVAAKFCNVPHLGVPVECGPVLDGVHGPLRDVIKVSRAQPAEVNRILQDTGAEIVLNLLPVGANRATRWYAEQSLKAGCAFINATPTALASDRHWAKRFSESKLAVAGDDLMDQIGATIFHRAILSFLNERGVHVDETYQLDVGGGTESLSTLARAKNVKRKIKTVAVQSDLPYKTRLVAGTTDYVPFLENRRDNFLWVKGSYFGRAELAIDIRFSASEAENAGSVLLDVIRTTRIAVDRGVSGPLVSVSAYGFKRPPVQVPLNTAQQWFNEFIEGERSE